MLSLSWLWTVRFRGAINSLHLSVWSVLIYISWPWKQECNASECKATSPTLSREGMGKKTSRDTFTVPAKHFQVSNVVLTLFTRLSLHGATSLPQLMAQAESPWRTASLPDGTEHYSCSHLFLCHFIGPEIFKDLIVFKAFWISHQYLPGLDHQQYSPQKFEVPSSSGLLLRYKIYRQMELHMTFFLLSSRVFIVS